MGLGILDQPLSWLADPNLAMASVIAVNVWAGIPFFTVNMLAGMASIDDEMYEAASIDGANAWEKFRNITLPSLRFVIAIATLLSTIWTFNNFETIFLLTQGGPGNLTKVYSIMAYEKAIRSLQFGPGTAIAFSLVPVLLVFILLLSRFMRSDADDGRVTWQDRIIDGIGMLINLFFTIIALPFQLIGRAWRAIFPGHASTKSLKRQKTVGQDRPRYRLGHPAGIYSLPVLLDPDHGLQGQPADWPARRHLLAKSLDHRTVRTALLRGTILPLVRQFDHRLGHHHLLGGRPGGAGRLCTGPAQLPRRRIHDHAVAGHLPAAAALMFIPLYGILASLGVINTRWALILTYPTSMVPFATWLLMGYYRSIPIELEHAALVDGATRLQAFVRITLPLAKPALLAVTLFAFTNAWKEFLYAFVFISSQKLMTLPVGLAQTIFGDIYPWGMLMAASLLISLPVVVFYMWGQRFMVAGLTAGSVKG